MADIKVLDALQITVEEMKKYTDENTISHSQAQFLDESAKSIAKCNVGIYVQSAEPTEANNGDIWVDPDGDGNNIFLDATLTQEGYAADAKAVGDALAGKQPVGDYALASDIPSVPSWALSETKPTYTASEVGALPADTVIPSLELDVTLSEEGKAADAKVVGDKLGDLSTLTTTDKTSLVAAVNEVNAAIGDIGSILDEINGEVV
jgi:hypothetical protein